MTIRKQPRHFLAVWIPSRKGPWRPPTVSAPPPVPDLEDPATESPTPQGGPGCDVVMNHWPESGLDYLQAGHGLFVLTGARTTGYRIRGARCPPGPLASGHR